MPHNACPAHKPSGRDMPCGKAYVHFGVRCESASEISDEMIIPASLVQLSRPFGRINLSFGLKNVRFLVFGGDDVFLGV